MWDDMHTTYTSIGINFQIYNDIEKWSPYETNKKTIAFEVWHLDKKYFFHGLEYFKIDNDWKHIVRRNRDVMLSDTNWKKSIYYRYIICKIGIAFCVNYFIPMPSSVTFSTYIVL